MTVTSRGSFLSGLQALRDAVTQPVVTAANETGAFIRRGLTVASFNLLEAFVSDRLTELAARINLGQTQFLDLSDRLQRRAITNTLNVATGHVRRQAFETADLRALSADLGQSLGSTGASLHLSPFTWMWTGSNMSPEDLNEALRFLHVRQPFDDMRQVATRLGFPGVDAATGQPINLKEELLALAQQRHRCAHDAGHNITTVWLRAVPSWIIKYAISFDCLASQGARLLRDGDPGMLRNDQYVASTSVVFRFVRQRRTDFAEVLEGNSRATARGADRDAVYAGARGKCRAREVLVETTIAGEPVRWDIPSID